MIDPRCYRNRCHVWSLYWASQSIRPEEQICNVNYTLKSAPMVDKPYTVDNTLAVDRTILGTCDLAEQMLSSLFTFTDTDGNTLDAVEIVSLPENGYLAVDTTFVQAGDILTLADFTTGLYYHSDDTTNIAYTDEFLFRVRTAETGVFSDVGTITINVTLCTNVGPVATDNTVNIDRTVTASCLVDTEYTDGTIFTFTDADGDALEAVKIISVPQYGVLRLGQFTTVEVGDILDFSQAITFEYITSSSEEAAYLDTIQFQVMTEHSGDWSNTATLTFDVTTCTNTNELPVSQDNTLNIDRLTTSTCLMDIEYTTSIFTFTDTEGDALTGVKIETLPTYGTLTIGMSTPITAGQILIVPDDFNIYYHTAIDHQGSYVDTIQFSVRTANNTEFSNTSTLTIDVTECITSYTPCVTYEPYFNLGTGGVGFLNVGVLQSDTAVVGEYVIEWRYGSVTGDLALVSGSSAQVADEDVQVYHNPSNFPVPLAAGTYYPVIRWIEVDGLLYHSQPDQGDRYGEDLIDCVDLIDVLQPITVEALRCDNGPTGTPRGGYDHEITYNNTSDPAEAAVLSSTYYLNEDGSTKYIGYYFRGFQVSDQVRFYYLSGGNKTLLEEVAVGSDAGAYNLVGIGGTWPQYSFASVVNLKNIPYTVGDEILIEVHPSYAQPDNTNTNWEINLTCLEDIFTCNYVNEDWRTIDPCSIVPTFNEELCRLEVSFNTFASFDTQTPEYQYLYFGGIVGNNTHTNPWDNKGLVSADFTTRGYIGVRGNIGTCSDINDIITTTTFNGVVTLTFSDGSRYADWKTAYNEAQQGLLGTGWVNDPTDYRYYAGYETFAWSGTNCGDSTSVTTITWWYNDTITFDDLNFVVNITPSLGINQLTDAPCSELFERAEAQTTFLNTGYNLKDGLDITSHMIHSGHVRGRYIFPQVVAETSNREYMAIRAPKWNIDKVCGAPTIDHDPGASQGFYTFYKYSIVLVTTDETDPVNNFEMWDDTVNGDRSSDPADWTLLYKVDNGVVTHTDCVVSNPPAVENLTWTFRDPIDSCVPSVLEITPLSVADVYLGPTYAGHNIEYIEITYVQEDENFNFEYNSAPLTVGTIINRSEDSWEHGWILTDRINGNGADIGGVLKFKIKVVGNDTPTQEVEAIVLRADCFEV